MLICDSYLMMMKTSHSFEVAYQFVHCFLKENKHESHKGIGLDAIFSNLNLVKQIMEILQWR